MRLILSLFGLLLLVPCFSLGEDKATQHVLKLWSGTPPGATEAKGEEKDLTKPKDNFVGGKRLIRLGNVSTPTITVYQPKGDKKTDTAVIVCPGGAYNILAMDLEGTEVCEWLNSLGVTAILLKYRVPSPKVGERHLSPLMDAQRAVRLVRSKSKDWGIDPKKIGILGFSAGGNLAAMTATSADRPAYKAVDELDKIDPNLDFGILIYPAYLCTPDKTALLDKVRVTKSTPPMFLAHAVNDPVPMENSVHLYLALKKAGVPSELHVYDRGGHGYGLRKTKDPCTRWPQRCEEWLRARGLIK